MSSPTKKTAPLSKSQNLSTVSSEEFEKLKQKQIEDLKRRSIEDKKQLKQLEKLAQREQIKKAKEENRNSPFKVDEYKLYEGNVAKLKKKYGIP